MELLFRKAIRKITQRLHVYITAVPILNIISGRIFRGFRVIKGYLTVTPRPSLNPDIFKYSVDDTDKVD